MSIETLLKVAHLFNYSQDVTYDKIRKVANVIYYNDGKNGISNVTNINVDLFSEFINEFEFVFTTNFDKILDDVYRKEVFHLHGGFNYKKTINNNQTNIIKTEYELSPDMALLIWGKDYLEKEAQTKSYFRFPTKFPFSFYSILNNYYRVLEYGEFTEIHIWGYSGENDGHINSKIANNTNIKKIYHYISPEKFFDPDEKASAELEVKSIFGDSKDIILEPWNKIWVKFK
jgi:hypothetical protein